MSLHISQYKTYATKENAEEDLRNRGYARLPFSPHYEGIWRHRYSLMDAKVVKREDGLFQVHHYE